MKLDDKMIIQYIRGNDQSKRNWALYQFYISDVVKDWMSYTEKKNERLSISMEDVFQEALVVFDRNIRENKFEAKSSLTTYLISIMKWMVLGHQRKAKDVIEFKPDLVSDIMESPEFEMISNEKKSALDEILEKIDSRCRELLTHYKLDYSMKEIASIMGFSSPEMAKKQAYRCREKLRNVMKSNPKYLQIIKE